LKRDDTPAAAAAAAPVPVRWWQGEDAGGFSAAPYRRLALQLMHELASPGEPHSLLLAAPDRSALPAHAAVSLAFCIAEETGQRVALVDLCPAAPALSRALGCDDAPGVAELLVGLPMGADDPTLLPELPMLATSHERVSVLPAGVAATSGNGGRTPAHMAQLLKRLHAGFDVVVLSAGSVLHDTAALAAAPHAGLVLMLPTEHVTPVADLDAAQKALKLCKARKIGIVMISPTREQGGPR
jgi:Mrp family chromosome partitioning ATPase